MEFGSKYVYRYTDSEEESVSEDEFETGMDVRPTAFWFVVIQGWFLKLRVRES